MPNIHISPWHDLVYHMLSYLPVGSDDASSVFGERYVAWADAHLAAGGAGDEDVPRTITLDAAPMAALYASSRKGFLLHSLPLLWDDVESFLANAKSDFNEIDWPDEHRAQLAAALRAAVHPTLVELFRIALWSELRNGFQTFWPSTIAPRSRAYAQQLQDEIVALGELLPGLCGLEWVLCHPLRGHGRLLLRRPARPPLVAVGVADPALNVSAPHPVLQGCHEYFVSVVQRAGALGGEIATVPGRAGYAAFREQEEAALTLGARVLGNSPWRDAYFAWLRSLFPEPAPAETAGKLAEGAQLSAVTAAALDRIALVP